MNKYLIILAVFLISCKEQINSGNTSSTPVLTDEALLDSIQRQTINYYWVGVEPTSGAARERIHTDNIYPSDDREVVTSGGTGFGIMALIVGIDRGFIDRSAGVERLMTLVNFLEGAERFHGAWSHWIYPDGKAKPFSKFDDGGDLVETAFLAQGMIVAREYFKNGNDREKELAQQLDKLWREIDWQWYTNGENVLYWHWSPQYEWKMNFPVKGHNECLIMYVMAASSPTHPINAATYHEGYMRGGDVVSDRKMYGIPTVLDHYADDQMGVGPLFWSHYSHLGLNPNGLTDQYADWWALNQNHAKIHYEHSVRNPYGYAGYNEECWGLTSSYSMMGYAGHNPQQDLGVISPTAALSSFPYTPAESMRFARFLYEKNDSLVGIYGPYDAFSIQSRWHLPRYLAIDQLPIPVMIENHRTGLIWDLFMGASEVKAGLSKLGFSSDKI